MSSLFLLGALATVALATAAAHEGDAASDGGKVPEQLRAFLAGKVPPEKLEITYLDVRGLKGELRIVVHGTGKVEQRVVRREVPQPQSLSAESVRKLVELLIEQEAWIQKTPQAASLPGEGRATLKIVAGDAESTIWERAREMDANDRLIRISTLIEKLAWRQGALE